MATIEVTVTEELAGARLDKAIVALVEGASRSRVKRAIESGEVRVNGRIVPKGGVVKPGDTIALEDATVRTGEGPCVPEPDAKLTVLHESPSVLVVDKPAGQPTAPLREGETGTLAGALVGHYPELAGIGYSAREPGIVHRLDTDTSGLVIVARTAAAFEALRDALQAEQIKKEYLLLCASAGLPDDGTVEHPIANHPKDKKRVYPCIHPRDVMRYAPRPAMTHFTVVERRGPYALVRATAPRAVRHQLRAHFASIEHPLVGDLLYSPRNASWGSAPTTPNGAGPSPALDASSKVGGEGGEGSDPVPSDASADAGAPLARHALHASRVAFDGAGDRTLAFDVRSELPADMQALFDSVR